MIGSVNAVKYEVIMELCKFVVKHYSETPHPCIKGNGFDGLTVGDYRDEAEDFIKFVNELIEFKLQHSNSSQ